MSAWDTIVIGSGIGGEYRALAADDSVLVLEHNSLSAG